MNPQASYVRICVSLEIGIPPVLIFPFDQVCCHVAVRNHDFIPERLKVDSDLEVEDVREEGGHSLGLWFRGCTCSSIELHARSFIIRDSFAPLEIIIIRERDTISCTRTRSSWLSVLCEGLPSSNISWLHDRLVAVGVEAWNDPHRSCLEKG